MACNCINVMDARLKDENSRIQVGIVFGRHGSDGYCYPAIQTEKIDKKNRKKMGAIPTFCCFCGTKYVEDAPAENPEAGQ